MLVKPFFTTSSVARWLTYKGKIREKPKDLEEAILLWAKRAFLLLIREELGATVGDFVVAERVLFRVQFRVRLLGL